MKLPALATGILLVLAPFATAQDRPNVVLIYSDDLGYGDVSAYGAKRLNTPNIDRLAREGLRFTDAHAAAATCTPSRYALLTGEYAFRKPGTGILPGDAALIIEPGRTTLASVFQRAGYATGVVGKWHLGLGPAGGPDWNGEIKPGPLDIGFDSAFIMAATGDRVPTVFVENRRVAGLDPADPIRVQYSQQVGDWPTGRDHPELLKLHPSHGHDQTIVNGISRIGYMTGGKAALWKDEEMSDVFTGKATAFIEQHRTAPFFLYFAMHEPHVPRVPHPRFAGTTGLGPRGDAIAQLDWAVGQVLATLDRLDLARNTLVLFTSDNGPVVDDGYQDQAVEKLGGHAPAGPFRGGKYSCFEAGTRVPFIVRWPGHVKPGVSGALVSQVDFLASFATLLGAPRPVSSARDSEDVLKTMLGSSKAGRTELVEQGGSLALRQGRWKYIPPGSGPKFQRETNMELGNDPEPQLYDLASDPGEKKNLAATEVKKVHELGARLDAIRQAPAVYDVRSFGAKGDGIAVDSDAINAAVAAASAAGGGTVDLPAGRYLSFSIRLKSHVTLRFSQGAVLVAGDPASGLGQYDLPEDNPADRYQDFGHSHWRNSLISAIDVEDIAIVGPGLIDGSGLTRGGPGAPWSRGKAGDRPLSMGAAAGRATDPEAVAQRRMDGQGNKAIGLKRARNVTLRDFSILNGGHFAILATGVDTLTIDNVKVDTNRDGFDIDACRNVRISNVSVNSPNDDAIVLKSSYALGELRATENVTITNCHVSGYDVGSFLDGTLRKTQERAPDRDGVTGRIKLGTESNGGFRNITVSDCTFDRSRGFAIETVDGGAIEDVTVTNLTMHDVTTAPIFIRLGNRGRGPEGTPVGSIKRVSISHVVAYSAEPRFASIIAGIPGHPVEDVTLSDIRLVYRGGGTPEDGSRQPPEVEDAYPEPSMFGTVPAFGFFVRHASGISMRDVVVTVTAPDVRPPIVLHDVHGMTLDHVEATRGAAAAFAILTGVSDLNLRNVAGVADGRHASVAAGTVPYQPK